MEKTGFVLREAFRSETLRQRKESFQKVFEGYLLRRLAGAGEESAGKQGGPA